MEFLPIIIFLIFLALGALFGFLRKTNYAITILVSTFAASIIAALTYGVISRQIIEIIKTTFELKDLNIDALVGLLFSAYALAIILILSIVWSILYHVLFKRIAKKISAKQSKKIRFLSRFLGMTVSTVAFIPIATFTADLAAVVPEKNGDFSKNIVNKLVNVLSFGKYHGLAGNIEVVKTIAAGENGELVDKFGQVPNLFLDENNNNTVEFTEKQMNDINTMLESGMAMQLINDNKDKFLNTVANPTDTKTATTFLNVKKINELPDEPTEKDLQAITDIKNTKIKNFKLTELAASNLVNLLRENFTSEELKQKCEQDPKLKAKVDAYVEAFKNILIK
ncbi:hypothetical protein [Mycoplasma phocoenae]|uniref:Uncharacterized protein n=1 Tax=Mycoplasma phocoenae TaxID=754517 RepID=A0A858U490_9MOLU|nr:hypothetical protein [Mycoplasma phocoenae]QJG66889.1 hypothetical protein HGG69_00930 [Mycoplasma phocoenae]